MQPFRQKGYYMASWSTFIFKSFNLITFALIDWALNFTTQIPEILALFKNLKKMTTKRFSNHMSQYFIHNRTKKCLNWENVQLYAQNELISNVMPATGLKTFGMGACLLWCSISSSSENSLKTSGHRGYEFMGFCCLVWNLVPFLPDIGFQLLKSLWSSLTLFV